MNRSPARILAQFLVDQGEAFLTQSVDWCVQVNSMPAEKPDKRIAIYSTFARDAGSIMRTGQTLYHPGLQISVRAPTDEEAFDKIKNIQTKLDALYKDIVAIGGDSYTLQSFETMNPPFFLKQEEKNLRRYYIINGNLTYEEII